MPAEPTWAPALPLLGYLGLVQGLVALSRVRGPAYYLPRTNTNPTR